MAIYMAAILLLGDEEDDAFEPHNQVMRVTRRILRDVSILSRSLIMNFVNYTGKIL